MGGASQRPSLAIESSPPPSPLPRSGWESEAKSRATKRRAPMAQSVLSRRSTPSGPGGSAGVEGEEEEGEVEGEEEEAVGSSAIESEGE
eukprot:scaffold3293_cov32-Tisochrysis_lutea.AAC.1